MGGRFLPLLIGVKRCFASGAHTIRFAATRDNPPAAFGRRRERRALLVMVPACREARPHNTA